MLLYPIIPQTYSEPHSSTNRAKRPPPLEGVTIMSKKLEGQVALVTGGSSGIGLATAERFVAEGAHVYITGRRPAELDAAVRKIGGNVTAVQADVSIPADLDRLYTQIKQEKGKLDTIFVNAGGGAFLALGAITEEDYNDTVDTKLQGSSVH